VNTLERRIQFHSTIIVTCTSAITIEVISPSKIGTISIIKHWDKRGASFGVWAKAAEDKNIAMRIAGTISTVYPYFISLKHQSLCYENRITAEPFAIGIAIGSCGLSKNRYR
jgi:hypothetical protein